LTVRSLIVIAAWLITLAPTAALAQGDPAPPKPAATPKKPPAAQRPPAATKASLPTLVRRGPDGRILPLSEPITWAAVRLNPTITDDDRARLEPVMLARRAECEAIALRNLDIVESIEAGAIDAIEGDIRQRISITRQMLAPLRPEGGDFCARLGRDGVLNAEQARASKSMVSQYLTALRGQNRADLVAAGTPREGLSEELLQRLQLVPVDETIGAHRMLVVESSRSLDRSLAVVSWPAETVAAIEPQRAALAANPDDESRAQLTKKLMAALTIDQRRELLDATIKTRPPR